VSSADLLAQLNGASKWDEHRPAPLALSVSWLLYSWHQTLLWASAKNQMHPCSPINFEAASTLARQFLLCALEINARSKHTGSYASTSRPCSVHGMAWLYCVCISTSTRLKT
jgi:hypothetical protein